MKKVFYTIATWFKSMFAKKPTEVKVEETVEETVEDKKQILRDYNKEKVQSNEYDMVLSQTVRASKPSMYKNSKNITFATGEVRFSLTVKQGFFLNEIWFMKEKNQDADINDVVKNFLESKYSQTQMNPTESELKPSYHKKTINYLLKCGAIKKTGKNHYTTTF